MNPISIDEVDGDLRLLAEALKHVESPRALHDLHVRIDALKSLRRSLVAEEVERLSAEWLLSWPGTRPPLWPGQSAEGVGA